MDLRRSVNDPSTICRRSVDDPSTQDRLGKDRLGKDRLGKDRERERTPTGSKRESGKRFPVAYQEVADLYNRLCPSLSRVTALSDARKKAIKARLKKYSLKDLSRAFAMAEESDFLKGANNRDWSANFDWILKDANLAKILDGNYANRVKNKTGRGSPGDHVDDYLLGVINGEIKL